MKMNFTTSQPTASPASSPLLFSNTSKPTSFPTLSPTLSPTVLTDPPTRKNSDIEIIRLPTYTQSDPVDVFFLIACFLLSVCLTFYMGSQACKKNQVQDIALHDLHGEVEGDSI